MLKINLSLKNFVARNWPLILFCLVHAAIVLWIFQSSFVYGKLNILRSGFSDSEYHYALQFAHGYWPYRDFSVEYPPIFMINVSLPILIASSFHGYILVYTVEVLLLDLGTMLLLKVLSRELGYNSWATLGIYTMAFFAIGPLIVTRLDFVPAILTLLSIFFFVKRYNKTAWAFLAIAILAKIYPAVLVPVFFLIQINRKQKGELLEALAIFLITMVVISAPFILMSENGLWNSLFYHAQRPLQIESTYASVIELLYAMRLFTLNFTNSFNSLVVTGLIPDTLAKISFGVMVLGLIAVYWSLYQKLKNRQATVRSSSSRMEETSLTIDYCLISILVFIVTCKVFSPQYIIWLLPLIPLTSHEWRKAVWPLFIIVCVLTFLIYPQYYDGIRDGSLLITSMLVIRNFTLIGIVLLLVRSNKNIYKDTRYLPGT